MTDASAITDGRVLRGERNRTALVEALLELVDEGDVHPTAPRIAERAGLSLRTVFQHFADMESLYAAVADRQTERVRALVAETVDPSLPLARRIDGLVEQRARFYETVTPVRRASLLVAHRSPELTARLEGVTRYLRRQLATTFEPELAALGRGRRSDVLSALEVATSWETWDSLRRGQRRSAAAAARTVRVLVGATLGTMGS
ncbi:MAG TPA: TetR/AcrR family transcriptional regulator [Acidimicrobiia bacterium]|nr:TetR/AcrR family transcriptional regulator [Acidimicrobiia bacterium]